MLYEVITEHEETVGAEGGVMAGQVDRCGGGPASLALHRLSSGDDGEDVHGLAVFHALVLGEQPLPLRDEDRGGADARGGQDVHDP